MSQSWDLFGFKTAETTSGNLWETKKSDFEIIGNPDQDQEKTSRPVLHGIALLTLKAKKVR